MYRLQPLIMTESDILVLGIGNLLLGDEGIGVHVAQFLEKHGTLNDADILDGGTGGFHWLEKMESYPYVIIVDATMDNDPAGTVKIIEPKFAHDYPPSLSAHDVGLKDLIGSLYLLGKVPKVFLVVISISGIQPMTMDLSPAVAASIPVVIYSIESIIEKEISFTQD